MAKKLTILFIHHGQGIGGASMSLLYLTKGLIGRGFNVSVLFLQDSQALELFKKEGITCLGPLNKSDFSHTVIWWYKWYQIRSLTRAIIDNLKVIFFLAKQILNKHRPDILHLNTSSLFVWAWVAKKMGIKVVCHIREPLAKGYLGLRKMLVKSVLENSCDAILPISINESLPWKGNKKVNVVYNAVPEEFCIPKKNPTNFNQFKRNKVASKSILFLGGMSEQKGTLLLLESLKLLVQNKINVKLVIAGNFFYEQSLLKNKLKITSFSRYCARVKKLADELSESIEFKGLCTNVPELINRCDLLVFPATSGHFARPIIEAGFCKKPVIATNLPPLNELVLNGKTGFLVKPDKRSLAEKLILILTNESLAKNMGISNYIFCKKNFCLSNQINRISGVYYKLFRE